jgi:hypothetical protein
MMEACMRTIEENATFADPFTMINVNDLTFIHLYLKRLTMINYRTDHPLVTHEDMANLCYMCIYTPRKYQLFFLMEYGRMSKYAMNVTYTPE